MSRRGFTFIEAMACCLILVMGILGAVSLVLYGIALAGRAQAHATGMSTAVSLAYDPAPLLPAGATLTTTGSTTTGWLNGYYVQRVEQADPVPNAPGLVTVAVQVDVYDGLNGKTVSSFNTRFVRRTTWP